MYCCLGAAEPGFGNQKFMMECLPKVKLLRSKFADTDIEVDGGLNADTVHKAAAAGANVIVAGTSIFGSTDPAETISSFRKSVINSVIQMASDTELK